MNHRRLYTILLFIGSALMLASAVIALRSRPQMCGGGRGFVAPDEPVDAGDEPDDVVFDSDARAADASSTKSRNKSGKTLAERNKDKFNVGEMRREAEDMLQRFRGTPEERQSVIEECKDGKSFILAITDEAVAAFDDKSPDELRKAREDFEKDYRAQLDYLQTGKLQRMLKTPEEQEVIGSAIEVVQQFLERLDEGLHAAGY